MSKNVYSSPEAFGLTLVGEINPDLCYRFDITAVWEKDGKVYAARSEGCSCLEPFENYTDITHLTEIRDAENLRQRRTNHGNRVHQLRNFHGRTRSRLGSRQRIQPIGRMWSRLVGSIGPIVDKRSSLLQGRSGVCGPVCRAYRDVRDVRWHRSNCVAAGLQQAGMAAAHTQMPHPHRHARNSRKRVPRAPS